MVGHPADCSTLVSFDDWFLFYFQFILTSLTCPLYPSCFFDHFYTNTELMKLILEVPQGSFGINSTSIHGNLILFVPPLFLVLLFLFSLLVFLFIVILIFVFNSRAVSRFTHSSRVAVQRLAYGKWYVSIPPISFLFY